MRGFRLALAPILVSFMAHAADMQLAVDGPAISVSAAKPGEGTRLVFEAKEGQRLGFGITGLAFEPASATGVGISVRGPDGRPLPGLERIHCAPGRSEGACDGEFTVARSGRHAIEVEAPFSTSPRFSAQLSNAIARALAVGGSDAFSIARPGQDAWVPLEVQAGQEVTVAIRDLSAGDKSASFALRLHRPDGSLAGEAAADARLGASLSIGRGAPAGAYRIEVDPERAGKGSFRLAAKATTRAPDGAADIASEVNEELRFVFTAAAGDSVSVGLQDIVHSPDVDSNSRLLVLGPEGKRIGGAGCRTVARGQSRPCKILLANLAAGDYAIVVAPPSGASVAGRLHRAADHVSKLDPSLPNRLELQAAGQVARVTFGGKAGERVGISLANIGPDGKALVSARLEGPPGGPALMRGASLAGTTAQIPPFELPATGTYTLVLDPGFGKLSVEVSLTR
jgi:hypothetical protein